MFDRIMFLVVVVFHSPGRRLLGYFRGMIRMMRNDDYCSGMSLSLRDKGAIILRRKICQIQIYSDYGLVYVPVSIPIHQIQKFQIQKISRIHIAVSLMYNLFRRHRL